MAKEEEEEEEEEVEEEETPGIMARGREEKNSERLNE